MTAPSVCAVYKQVVRNQPNIDKQYARKLSENIVFYTNKYDLKPNKYTAILMQESGYKLDAYNKRSKDFGLAQININTAKAFKFNIKKLTSDLEYAVEAGAIVLYDFKKRHYKKEKDFYFTRYNSSKPTKRKVYQRKVARFY